MGLTLHFITQVAGGPASELAAPYFRFAGEALLAGPDGREIARHEGWIWQVGHGAFPVLATRTATEVRFEDHDGTCAERVLAVEGVTVADGGLWEGPKAARFLAKYDPPSDCWHVFSHPRKCPAVSLWPAAGRRATTGERGA